MLNEIYIVQLSFYENVVLFVLMPSVWVSVIFM